MNTIPAAEPPTAGRALVVHESMFGNTATLARSVAHGLAEEGLTVTTADVASVDARTIGEYDLVVTGAPTHAFSMSRPNTRADAQRQGATATADAPGMREWLEELPAASGGTTRFAVFDSRVTKVRKLPFTAGRAEARLLQHQGYEVVGKPAGFTVVDVSGPLDEGEEARAAEWGRALGRVIRRQRVATDQVQEDGWS